MSMLVLEKAVLLAYGARAGLAKHVANVQLVVAEDACASLSTYRYWEANSDLRLQTLAHETSIKSRQFRSSALGCILTQQNFCYREAWTRLVDSLIGQRAV